MARPKAVIETERSGWRVPQGTNALVELLKASPPPPGAGEWTEGRVVAWGVIALVDQMCQDQSRSPAERALLQERAGALREQLRREADAKANQ